MAPLPSEGTTCSPSVQEGMVSVMVEGRGLLCEEEEESVEEMETV